MGPFRGSAGHTDEEEWEIAEMGEEAMSRQ
jgi:hypothetical protein